MLKVPSRRPGKPFGMDVKLTVSRRFEGAVEVSISAPGRLKAAQASQPATRGGKAGASLRARKVDRG